MELEEIKTTAILQIYSTTYNLHSCCDWVESGKITLEEMEKNRYVDWWW